MFNVSKLKCQMTYCFQRTNIYQTVSLCQPQCLELHRLALVQYSCVRDDADTSDLVIDSHGSAGQLCWFC